MFTIGDAANKAGVTTRAVRLYEAKGLLAPAERTESGYRLFTDDDVETLSFIRRGRRLGLSLEAIAEVLALSRTGAPCDRTRTLLNERVNEIDDTISDLQQLRATIVAAQQADCSQAGATRCAMIESAATG